MGFGRLIVMSSCMLIATLIASFTPLYLNLKPRTVQKVSIYSTGLLLGAALTIVIPEGISAVFENTPENHDDHEVGHDHDHGHSGSHENSQWIGLALVAGFTLMYIIDSMHNHDPPHHHPTTQHRGPIVRSASSESELAPLSRDLNDWEETGRTSASIPPSLSRSSSYNSYSDAPTQAFSTVVGLLVHSVADGISLGASSVSSSAPESTATAGDETTLDLIIFLAIMVHKAPAAFALSTLLSSTPGVSAWFRRRSLMAFSLAAPLGAVVTYMGLNLVGAEGGSGVGWWTGIALVFSGGTFLFVATHVMKAKEESHDGDSESDVASDVGGKQRMALVLAGMMTPFILSSIVGHGH